MFGCSIFMNLITLSERLYMYCASASAMMMPLRFIFLKSTCDLWGRYSHVHEAVSDCMCPFKSSLYVIQVNKAFKQLKLIINRLQNLHCI